MSHTTTVCAHNATISTCRCPSTKKTIKVQRPCPFGNAHLGMVVVHPEPPETAIGPGLGQAPVLRTPDEWCEIKKIRIKDPDGWRAHDRPDWETPLTEEIFDQLAGASTVQWLPGSTWSGGMGPDTPLPRPSEPEEIYRAAINRYFRNTDFCRRVDETMEMIKGLGLSGPDAISQRVLLTGVIVGMYQAGV